MLRSSTACVLLFAGCAHAPEVIVSEPAPRVALPVRLTVKSLVKGTYEELVPKTERMAMERFEAQGHPVRGEADYNAEIEIASIGGGVDENTYKFCVRMQGRMVHNDQRFALVDVVKERCDKTELRSGAPHDVFAVARVVQALTGARDPENEVLLELYESAVAELVDALGRQATRPATSSSSSPAAVEASPRSW